MQTRHFTGEECSCTGKVAGLSIVDIDPFQQLVGLLLVCEPLLTIFGKYVDGLNELFSKLLKSKVRLVFVKEVLELSHGKGYSLAKFALTIVMGIERFNPGPFRLIDQKWLDGKYCGRSWVPYDVLQRFTLHPNALAE
eukprot:10643025-Ditylum_brightwellii.AAC.1